MKRISAKLDVFLNDESGELTVDMVILIAALVLISIAAMIVVVPGYNEATQYSVDQLDFDRAGVENPECRYVKGYQESPLYKDSDGNIILTCSELYQLQRDGVDIHNPDEISVYMD